MNGKFSRDLYKNLALQADVPCTYTITTPLALPVEQNVLNVQADTMVFHDLVMVFNNITIIFKVS